MELFLLLAVIAFALLFDFTNGFHDAANSIATVVTTGALKPRMAVAFAAILNFVGAFVSIKVATTIAKGVVDSSIISLKVLLAGLLGSIIWNFFTWWKGLPSSSSHALIGGLIGASVAAAGFGVVHWDKIKDAIVVPSFAAPVIGVAIAAILITLLKRFSQDRFQSLWKKLQLVSSGFVSFTHGTNDAQKTMGIIALALLIYSPSPNFEVPVWVIIMAGLTMALGTYMGGWRVINTLGKKLTMLKPVQGFAAETATGSILYVTAHLGFPVSTTHTITGSIVGAGVSNKKKKRLNWKITREIMLAWVFTLPITALVGAGAYYATLIPGGIFYMILIALVTCYLGWRVRDKNLKAMKESLATA